MDKTKIKVYQHLANCVQAYNNCKRENKTDWMDKWEREINAIVEDFFPHGSGFDSETTLNLDESTGEKLVFETQYHHMSYGMYDGWTEHTITVKPSLVFGFHIKISGKDRNGIKDYIREMFSSALDEETDYRIKE